MWLRRCGTIYIYIYIYIYIKATEDQCISKEDEQTLEHREKKQKTQKAAKERQKVNHMREN